MNLYQKTLKLLENKSPDVTLQIIAQDLNLSYSWICKFSSGDIVDPRYNRLQKLHDYLVKRQAH